MGIGKIFKPITKIFKSVGKFLGITQDKQEQHREDAGYEVQHEGAAVGLACVYGETKCGSTVTYNRVSNYGKSGSGLSGKLYAKLLAEGKLKPINEQDCTEGEWYCLVYTLAEGPIEEIVDIQVDGDSLLVPIDKRKALKTCGTIPAEWIAPKYKNQIIAQYNTGAGAFHFNEIALRRPEYDETCKGIGLAQIALVMRRDNENGEIQNKPDLECIIKGKKIIDYNSKNRNLVYTNENGNVGANPSWCILDFVTSPFGMNVDINDIDIDTFKGFASYSALQGNTCNGGTDPKKNAKANLERLQDDFQCTVIHSADKWKIIWNAPQEAVCTITEDDIISEVVFNPAPTMSEFNALEIEFRDRTKNFQRDTLRYPSMSRDELILRDGFEKPTKLTRDFTCDKAQVDRIAGTLYEMTRDMKEIKFKTTEVGYALEVGDVVNVDHPLLDKITPFRVMDITRGTELDEMGTAELQLMEYKPNSFKHKHVADGGKFAPVEPEVFDPPTNLSFKIVDVGATMTGLLEWAPSSYTAVDSYVIQYKLNGAPKWDYYESTKNPYLYCTLPANQRWDFRVQAKSVFNHYSDPAEIFDIDASDDSLMPQITGLQLVTTDADKSVSTTKDFQLKWNDMLDTSVRVDPQFYQKRDVKMREVFDHYEIEVYHGKNAGKRTAVYSTKTPDLIYTFKDNATNGVSRYVEFRVRCVSKGGAKSQAPAVLKALNPQCKQPDGIEVSATEAGLHVLWSPSAEDDYIGTRLYFYKKSISTGYKITEADVIAETNSGFYVDGRFSGNGYVRLANYDVFGKDDLNLSPEVPVSAISILEKLEKTKGELLTQVQNDLKGLEDTIDTEIKAAKEAALKGDAVVQENLTSTEAKLTQKITDTDKKQDEKTTKAINAASTTLNTAIVDGNKAIAKRVDTVETKMGDVSAKVETQAKTITDIEGNVEAKWFTSLNANGAIAGIEMYGNSKTKTSSLVLQADKIVLRSNTGTDRAQFQVSGDEVVMNNAIIKNLGAGNIAANAITSDKIAANAVSSNHLTANVQLNTPTIIMPQSRIGDGHAGFGVGGPYSAWGSGWNTLIAVDGTIYTNKLQASSGKIANMQIANCTITEDCHVNGFLYADKIIGLPEGKAYGLGEFGVPIKGQWKTVAEHTVKSPEGRFSTSCLITMRGEAGGYANSMYGYNGWACIGCRVLVNGVEIWREAVDATPRCDHEFHTAGFSWSSIPVNVGSQGGVVTLQVTTVAYSRYNAGQVTKNWDVDRVWTNRDYVVLVRSMEGCFVNWINK
ncbi:hypothetical protein CK627_20825 [Aeromonas dhakensis]|uniref:phage tail protein n=1 Tax=Aeromonas dhakensis TaxID=196024 RepID=UPI000BAAC33D|nr:phage tail protein [Aeromonas dhakensis]ASX13053.1 hypothetical protein CK627_20825 [Aeromonas dhakensis]